MYPPPVFFLNVFVPSVSRLPNVFRCCFPTIHGYGAYPILYALCYLLYSRGAEISVFAVIVK